MQRTLAKIKIEFLSKVQVTLSYVIWHFVKSTAAMCPLHSIPNLHRLT